jgi:hypothetical protein
MKKSLGFDSASLLSYIKAKSVREYNDTNLIVSIDKFE